MKRIVIAAVVVLIVMPFATVQACGPDFAPDVFVRKMRPDNPKEFAAGKLGVLLPTYPRMDLAVAFRYLNGGSLNVTEQRGYKPTYSYLEPEWEKSWDERNSSDGNDPVKDWQSIHARYAGSGPSVDQQRSVPITNANGFTYQSNFENCSAGAFETAVSTAQARAKTWGEKSSELIDWVAGQDAVFANCAGKDLVLPKAAPANASALLRADRAYQSAAAHFYAMQFDAAREGFEAIGHDATSPWHGLARYVAARCLIRQSFNTAKPNDSAEIAPFSAESMKKAQILLESLLKEKPQGISRIAVQRELDFVRIRTEPLKRLSELSVFLAGPRNDLNYEQHLTDLTWYLNVRLDSKPVRQDADLDAFENMEKQEHGIFPDLQQKQDLFRKTYTDLTELRATSALVDWLITFQSPVPEATQHAINKWKETGQLYWLVAAICKADARDPFAAELVKSAENTSPDSPAWESLTYHRARLLIGLGRGQEARALLEEVIPRIRDRRRDSSTNLFQGLRMRSAASLDEALRYVPRKVLSRTSEEQSGLDECLDVMKNPKRKYDCRPDNEFAELDADSARFFNLEAPLDTLVDAADPKVLPDNLRASIAAMAWVRSVLLGNDTEANRLLPHLPAKLQQQAGPGTGFRPLMALLRNPGLRPYLDPGVQRFYSYDFVESYADNWWCRDWGLSWWEQNWQLRGQPNEALLSANESASFLTATKIAEGRQQSDELRKLGDAEIVLGQRTLAYAKAHPDDGDVPEALFLVLRMIRYGCNHASWTDSTEQKKDEQQIDEVRRAAARLLRERYPANVWTKKAAPFAG